MFWKYKSQTIFLLLYNVLVPVTSGTVMYITQVKVPHMWHVRKLHIYCTYVTHIQGEMRSTRNSCVQSDPYH